MSVKRTYLKLLFFIIFTFSINNVSAQNEIIVKQIDFKLDFVSDNSYENEYFITIKLTKGLKYIFKIKNHIDDYAGEAIVELLDADKLVITNFIQDKYYEKCGFICNKTGFYDVLVRYKDNTVGHSTIDIYMVQ